MSYIASYGSSENIPSKRRSYPKRKRKSRRVSVSKSSVDRKQSSEIKALKKVVKSMKKDITASLNHFIYRKNSAIDIASGQNAQNFNFTPLNNVSGIEAPLSVLKFFDEDAPTVLQTIDMSANAYQNEIQVDSSSVSVTVRANYNTPVYVTAWECTVRRDTSLTPIQCMTNGIADQSNASAFTDVGVIPSDYKLATELWSFKLLGKPKVLDAGKQCTFSIYKNKKIKFDPAEADSHNLSYQKTYHAGGILLKIHGVVGHDSTADQQGLLDCEVDLYKRENYKIAYNGGYDGNYIYYDNSALTTMTTAAIQANKPQSVIQAMSAT